MKLIRGGAIGSNPKYFAAFNALSTEIFGLSFASWRAAGYWSDFYIPYTWFDGEKAVANVSANRIYTRVDGSPKLYLQLGTVMTDPAYRHRGLIRAAMDAVLHDWKDQCDGIYLYANETVLDFYPKLGFVPALEYQMEKLVTPRPGCMHRLDMHREEDVEILRRYFDYGNPFSAHPLLENFSLLMFYCGGIMDQDVYELQERNIAVVVSYVGDTMILHDIYCREGGDLDEIIAYIARSDTGRVRLGFTPRERRDYAILPIREEGQLFVYAEKENMFAQEQMMMPLISHA